MKKSASEYSQDEFVTKMLRAWNRDCDGKSKDDCVVQHLCRVSSLTAANLDNRLFQNQAAATVYGYQANSFSARKLMAKLMSLLRSLSE